MLHIKHLRNSGVDPWGKYPGIIQDHPFRGPLNSKKKHSIFHVSIILASNIPHVDFKNCNPCRGGYRISERGMEDVSGQLLSMLCT